MDAQSLTQALQPFLPTSGAYPRHFKLASNAALAKQDRLDAALLLLEKAMGQQNLE